MSGQPGQRALRLALWGMIVLAGGSTALSVAAARARARLPFQLDYGEGIVLWQAMHVLNLREAFRPLTEYPYIVFHYTPLYHVVTRLGGALTGDLLLAGRSVALLCGVWVALAVGAIVVLSSPRRLGLLPRAAAGLTAGALALQIDVMDYWMPLARVDLLGLALTFSGMALVIRGFEGRAGVLWGFALFVAALFTKQTLIAAPLACLAVLAVVNRRRAVVAAGFYGLTCLALVLVLAAATEGETLRHWFNYQVAPLSVSRLAGHLVGNFRGMHWLVPIAATLATTQFLFVLGRGGGWSKLLHECRRSPCRRAVALYTLHFLICLPLTALVAKEGSNVNYFLEWNLACCVLAGLLLVQFLLSLRRRALLGVAEVALLLCFLAVLANESMDSMRSVAKVVFGVPSGETPTLESVARTEEELVQVARQIPGDVVCENMMVLWRAGKRIPFEPLVVKTAAESGQWDEGPLVEMTQAARFSAFIFPRESSRFSGRMKAAIQQAYQPVRTIEPDWIVYLPRQGAGRP